MIKSKKIKTLFLTLNTICILGLFHVKAMEKFLTHQDRLNNFNNNLFTQNTSKYEYTFNVIDPQYDVEVRDGINPYDGFNKNQTRTTYFMLDGKCVFYKKNEDVKYYSVNVDRTSRVQGRSYDYLPAADDKYEIKKSNSTGKIYYFYKGALVYRLVQEGNKIYYVNVKTDGKEFYSFKGKKGYYSIDKKNKVYTSLPFPGSENKVSHDFDNKVIDPQYKIKVQKEFLMPDKKHEELSRIFYFCLDGKALFYRRHYDIDPFFYDLNFERMIEYKNRRYYDLPAADDKYEIKRHGDNLFYYYNREKAYKLEKDGNKIFYVNAKNGEREFYSFIGIKEYYLIKKTNDKENIIVYDNLPLPGSVLHNRITPK